MTIKIIKVNNERVIQTNFSYVLLKQTLQQQQNMKPQAEDDQWQGFERETDHKIEYSVQPCVLPTLNRTLHTIQKTKTPQTQNPPQKPNIVDLSHVKQQKHTFSFLKIYPKIPIIKPKEEIYRSKNGTLLYRGVEPKFSDRYFLTHKDQKQYPQLIYRDNLVFNSRFECGNLNRVYKMAENTYDVYMRVDTNTQGHLQWYYFEVKNSVPQTAVINVFRFKKKLSLYQRGMKPYIRSKREGTGWRQGGAKIKYQLSDPQNPKCKDYILSFQYNFRYENDQVLFAACPPYSYTLLTHRLTEFSKTCKCEVTDIGQTLAGLKLPLVTFGNEDNKNFIVISARTHPGQTSSSWVMDGLMSYLSSDKADELIQAVTFKIVPMLNPDGVYVGNYRTGIIGKDFNRCFNQNSSSLIPEVSQLKCLVKNLQKKGKVLLYLDLHGHSIQRNSFVFGPEIDLFPTIFKSFISDLSMISSLFKQSSCKLKTKLDCADTARGYFQNSRKLFALTIQNSLGLYETDNYTYPILTNRWRLFGKQIGQVIGKAIQEVISTRSQFANQSESKTNDIKSMTSQLEILNKKIIQKVEKRVTTEKTQLKEKDKKFLGKRKFEMMRWKKLGQIKNTSPDKPTTVGGTNRKSRRMSQQIKAPEVFLKQQIEILQSKTTKNQVKGRNELFRPSQIKIQTNLEKAHKKIQQGFISLRQVKQQISTNQQVPPQQMIQQINLDASQIKSPPLVKQLQKQALSPSFEQRKVMSSSQNNKRHINEQEDDEPLQTQVDNLSQQFSQFSDINDHQNISQDLEPQQIQTLLNTVNMINKNRIFKFQEEVQEKRINKFKQSLQKRIIKQPSFHSMQPRMEVSTKFKEIKLSLNSRSTASRIKKSFDEEREVTRHKYRKTLNDPIELSSSIGVQYPYRQLPTLDIITSTLKQLPNKDFLHKPINFSRAPITNHMHRVSIIEQTIREEILIQTSKKFQKLQDKSIFSSKPFEDTFLRNKSKFLDIKRKI